MRKTGTRLLAVLAAVSMTVSLFPVNAVTAAQTDKAQSVQAADSLKKASKAPVTFSEASGTYKDAFSLKLQEQTRIPRSITQPMAVIRLIRTIRQGLLMRTAVFRLLTARTMRMYCQRSIRFCLMQ